MKPKPKTELALVTTIPGLRYVTFYATRDAAEVVAEFGDVQPYDEVKDKYTATIDARYDFDEVVAYLQEYGKK